MTQFEIDDLAQVALDEGIRAVQEKLASVSGDVAGYYWASDKGDDALDLFRQYIKMELLFQEEGNQND